MQEERDAPVARNEEQLIDITAHLIFPSVRGNAV